MFLSPGDREAGVWLLTALLIAMPFLLIGYAVSGRAEIALPVAVATFLAARRLVLWLNQRHEAKRALWLAEALEERRVKKSH